MRTPCKNETRFFAAGDDLNGMSQGCFGLGEKFGGIFGNAQCLRAYGPDVFGVDPRQLFLKACERLQGALLRLRRQIPFVIKTRGKPHGFLPIAFRQDLSGNESPDFNAKAVAA